MRLISLFLLGGIGAIVLAGCDSGASGTAPAASGDAATPTTAAPARVPAAAPATSVVPPPPAASCELNDPTKFAIMAYTDQSDPRKYLRGDAFRAAADAYKFVTPVANGFTRLQRYGGGKCGAKKVVPECSTLTISSDLKMTLIDVTGANPKPVFTDLQLTPNNANGKAVDYLQSDEWTNSDGTFTLFVYFLDNPAANGTSTTQEYKYYKIEVFEKGGGCDNERPDHPGNITNTPPPPPPDPIVHLKETDTTQGHEGHN